MARPMEKQDGWLLPASRRLEAPVGAASPRASVVPPVSLGERNREARMRSYVLQCQLQRLLADSVALLQDRHVPGGLL